jgi:hypothetical protein
MGQSRHHFILQLEKVRNVLLETVGPQMRAGFGVDELRIDPHAVLISLDRPFEHISNAEFLADLLGVDALALVSEGRVAGDDETVLDARKFGGEILGHAVGEIILTRIPGEIGERKHDNRKMGGLRRFHQATAEDGPATGGSKKQKGGDGGNERGGAKAPLRPKRLCRIGRGRGRIRRSLLADFQRVDANGLDDVLEMRWAQIGDLEIEPLFHLPVGLLGQADRARFGNALQPRGDIHTVAHEVAVALLNDVAEVDADAILNALFCRQASVALG